MFYIKNAPRMYLPGELRQHGLPINLSIFASRRFGLDLRKTDFDVGAIPLPVLLMDNQGQHVAIEIDAVPTSEGYYQALIPIGQSQFTAGVQLGRIADWVQIEEASFHPIDAFLDAKDEEGSIPAHAVADGMEDMGSGPDALRRRRSCLPAGAGRPRSRPRGKRCCSASSSARW